MITKPARNATDPSRKIRRSKSGVFICIVQEAHIDEGEGVCFILLKKFRSFSLCFIKGISGIRQCLLCC